ncbi:MAG TPA: cytochrome c oxidase subunit II [Actinomycetota bacterium]|nr:cytochrome c oxidase subunit II [Actinomycetota bacterium]
MRRATRPALASLILLATACAKNAPYDTLSPEGPIARTQDALFKPVFWIAVVVFVLVEGALVYAMVRFRDRGQEGLPRQVHGSPKLEIAWTIAPALILAAIAVPTVVTIFDLSERQPGGMKVNVIGHQWWWEYRYPDGGVVTATDLHIPTGRPVYLDLEAYEEGPVATTPAKKDEGVIHSFWPPKLAGKQDVVPGRVNRMTIQADRPGVYEGQCAEFCGLSHANMRLTVIAHSQQDFDRWLADQKRPAAQPSGGRAASGLQAFREKGCASCHAIGGVSEGLGGPNLTHLASRETFAGGTFRRTDENLEQWLRNPPGMKPGSKMPNLNLSQDEIDGLVAYLQTLK